MVQYSISNLESPCLQSRSWHQLQQQQSRADRSQRRRPWHCLCGCCFWANRLNQPWRCGSQKKLGSKPSWVPAGLNRGKGRAHCRHLSSPNSSRTPSHRTSGNITWLLDNKYLAGLPGRSRLDRRPNWEVSMRVSWYAGTRDRYSSEWSGCLELPQGRGPGWPPAQQAFYLKFDKSWKIVEQLHSYKLIGINWT